MNLDTMVLQKSISTWQKEYPIIKDMMDLKECIWFNNKKIDCTTAINQSEVTLADVEDAKLRLERFSNYIQVAFPETKIDNGIIESPVQQIPNMEKVLMEKEGDFSGELWIKLDSHLPISGSIKARGGIYEVLKLAEDIAIENNILKITDDYSILDSQKAKDLFSKYSIAVGSTGNLGLSIGIMSAKLGFNVAVHMSADAKQWKKDMLRSKGVTVVEYQSDYSVAVEQGRKESENNPYCHFVDDENSKTLFLGYAVAALRLKEQFELKGISIDSNNPLFVYLPCGVGGGPGGVAFGLKLVFKDNVHCFFAEPTHSCCMMLGMLTEKNNEISVQDFGIDNKTIADGLAVGRASGFVGKTLSPFMTGCYTIDDARMYQLLSLLKDSEGLKLEPSALAGMYGPSFVFNSTEFSSYAEKEKIADKLNNVIHLVWATGGNMVPEEEMQKYYLKGKSLV